QGVCGECRNVVGGGGAHRGGEEAVLRAEISGALVVFNGPWYPNSRLSLCLCQRLILLLLFAGTNFVLHLLAGNAFALNLRPFISSGFFRCCLLDRCPFRGSLLGSSFVSVSLLGSSLLGSSFLAGGFVSGSFLGVSFVGRR